MWDEGSGPPGERSADNECVKAPAVFCNSAITMDNGEAASMHLKAWLHDAGPKWELRRVLISLCVPLKRGVCAVWRQMQETWTEDLERFSFVPVEQHLTPSRRTLSYHQQELSGGVHDEACLSSHALLTVLLRFIESRRRKNERSLGLGMLRCLLSVVYGARCQHLLGLAAPGGCFELCSDKPMAREGEGEQCLHVLDFSKAMMATMQHERPCNESLATMCLELFARSSECPALRHWCQVLLSRVAAAFRDAKWDDASKFSFDAIRNGILPGGQQRRRLDEDFRDAACIDMLVSKRAKTTGEFLQADGQVCRQAGWRMDNLAVRLYMSAATEHLHTAKYISVCFDAARLGEPAKDTVVGLCWSMDRGFGAWLAPQALHGPSVGSGAQWGFPA